MPDSGNKENRVISVFTIIWFFLKDYKLRILTLLVMFLIVGILEAATIAAIYPILNAAFDTGAEQGNFILSIFEWTAGLLPISDKFVSYCVLFLVLAVIAFIVKLISTIYRVRFSAQLVEKNQKDIYDKLVTADYQYFIDHKQGELIYITATAPQRLSALLSRVTEFISQIFLSISVLVLLFSLSWQGSVGILLIALVYQLLARFLGRKVSYYTAKGEMEALQESNVILNETISGIKQLKAYAIESNWVKKFYDSVNKRWHFNVIGNIWNQIPQLVFSLIVYLAVGVVILVLKLVVPVNFAGLVPVFGAFAFAVFRLIPFVSNIGNIIMSILGALPDCEAVYSIQNDRLAQIEDGDRELTSFQSGITFEDVYFSHKTRRRTIEAVSITFEKGKTTAIVGRSGAGKTTIINLLLRLFDVNSGEIKVDGVNVKKYRLASWLRNIGYVSQDTFILNSTVENNITFDSGGYSREDVIKAAGYADAHDFISEMPLGYDTIVGDKGMRLSGGQAQRIAVARAMIRKPEILIFDEATNNLDSISEAAVQRAIDEISRDHTVIIIAHRLSTIVNADKIVVLENGRVEEQGTHSELIAKKGAYRRLYETQSA